jgi:predicted membrane protein
MHRMNDIVGIIYVLQKDYQLMQLFILCIYFLFFLLIFSLHVSGSHKPIIRGISSCVLIYNHLVYVVFMLFICVCLWSDLSWWFHCKNKKKKKKRK